MTLAVPPHPGSWRRPRRCGCCGPSAPGATSASVDLDEAARRRLIAAHRTVLVEVASTLSDPLIDELVALGVHPLDEDASLDELKRRPSCSDG